jgi:hypothetical protein
MEYLASELGPYEERIYEFADKIEKEWPNWDYHNFLEHGLETTYEFLSLVEYARANGVEVPTETVVAGVLSALEHDSFNQDGQPFLYTYMEERSAAIGDGIAKNIGFSQEIIDKKHNATLATRPGAEFDSLLDKMIRRADIANFAWDYTIFKEKTIKVWREEQKNCLKKGMEFVPFSAWAVKVRAFVNSCLLDQDLALGDFDRDHKTGLSLFHIKANTNLHAIHDEINSADFVEPELYEAA